MKPSACSSSSAHRLPLSWQYLAVYLMVALAFPPSLMANSGPTWWTTRGVIATGTDGQPLTADDYAAANQGQVKQIATAAAAELNANLPGGSGTAVQALITAISATSAQTDDYAAINLGQLKTVAKPFYDQLIAVGYTTGTYPWLSSTSAADDYALANIGQVKNLFSFDVAYDSKGDGVPDWWEIKYFGSGTSNWLTGTSAVPSGQLNTDGTPLTLQEAYQQQIDPTVNSSGTTSGTLRGDWEFDETSGTIAHDSSGNQNDGTLIGNGITWGIGYNGLGSLSITGTDGYASFPDNTHQLFSAVSGTASGPFSISFWFNLNSIPQGMMSPLMETCQPGGTGFRCGVDYGAYHPGHAPMFIFWTEGGGSVDLESQTVIQPQTWYQAVITDDGTTAKMYLNGQLESTSGGVVLPNNGPLVVGNWSDYDTLIGSIDNLLIYSKALGASDALALYNADSDGNGLPDWWEVQYFGAIGQTATAAVPSGQLNSDGTPVTLLEAYQDQYNPNDAYNGVVPTISIVSGTNQQANLNSFLPQPLVIKVSGSNGVYANAPVTLSMTRGDGEIGTSNTSTDTLTYSQVFYTDTDGQITFYGYTGSTTGTDIVTANAGLTATAQMTFTSVNGAVKVAAGVYHTLVLRADGTVWAYGCNSGNCTWGTFSGALGNGSTTDSAVPVEVIGLQDVTNIAAGLGSSIAVKSGGTVWQWGDYSTSWGDGFASQGNFGDAPTQVVDGNGNPVAGVTAVATGFEQSIALKNDGTVWTWTTNGTFTQILNADGSAFTGATAIAGGAGYSVVVKSDGTVWQWGSETSATGNVPVQVLDANNNPVENVQAIACNAWQVLALKNDGTVWGWGQGNQGELGSSYQTENVVCQITGTDGPLTNVTSIAAGAYDSFAIKSDGTVWEWGCMIESNNPTEVMDTSGITPLFNVIQIADNGELDDFYSHAVVLKNDGTVWGWGNNSNGQLGDGNTANSSQPVAVIWPDHTHQTVASGADFTVTIRNDGTVWSWGDNNSGQLGDGIINANSQVPVQTLGLTQIVAVVAGNSHALALKNDGTVWTWGNNSNGQLGNGTTANADIPVQVPNLTNIIAIAAGENHSMALKSDGTVYVWGSDSNGQIGDGNSGTTVTSPYQVTALPAGITAIGAGGLQSYAVTGSGNVYAWGDNSNGQIGNNATGGNQLTPALVVSDTNNTPLSGITAVSGGYLHALALKNDGTVWAWGGNTYGQLGNGNNTDSAIAVEVLSPDGTTPLSYIVAVAAEGYSSQAIDWDGTLWSWGDDSSGQLGDGTTTNSNLAEENDDAGGDVVAVSGGGNAAGTGGNTITIDAYGNIWAWGSNSSGQLGFGSTVDTNVVSEVGVPQSSTQSTLPGASAPPSNLPNLRVAGEGNHTLYIANDGTVWAWGANESGELGNGTTTGSEIPIHVKGLSGVVQVAANGDAFFAAAISDSLALKSDGTVWAWGCNANGQLGNGTTTNSSIPLQVLDSNDPSGYLQDVTQIATALEACIVLKNDGTVWTWGGNSSGELGNGTTDPTTTPGQLVQVTGSDGQPLSGIVAVAAGVYHFMALKSDGTLWTWGANWNGMLGNNTETDSAYPVEVLSSDGTTPLSNVVGIAAGSLSSFALTSDGTVWDWGAINWGTSGGENLPTQVDGTDGNPLSGIQAIAAGYSEGYALDNNGHVWAWGSNGYGQLGNGTDTDSAAAVEVINPDGSPFSNVTMIAAGGNQDDAEGHAMAITSDGALWTWGGNIYGQLGDASTTDSWYPVPVWFATPVRNSVAVGSQNTLLLQGNGTVWSFGSGTDGQPAPIPNLGQSISVTSGSASGTGLALRSDGTVWSATGTQITGLTNIVAISQSQDHALALKNDGSVWAWGSNANGQLGNNSTTNSSTPVQSGSLSGIIAVSAGYQYSMALTANGTVYTWGANSLGQLGNSNTTDQHLPVPVTTDGTTPLTGISAISAGGSHALAMGEDTSLWAWGDNSNGQLGNSNITAGSSNVPAQVTDSNGNALYGAMAISAGPFHSVALMNDSSVWAWGANAHGQLGNATTTDSNVPVPVVLSDGTTPLINIAAIGAGGSVANGDANSVAVNANGTVWVWGSNENNQLANGTGSDSDVAIQVPGILISNQSTSIGTDQTLMLKGDGTVWALGGNSLGQLGNGSTSDAYTTVSGQVIALDHAIGVTAGNYSSFAVKEDGSAWGWGWNGFGQLGNGSLANSDLPVQITGSDYTEMSAGDQDAVALKADGTVWDFGDNEFGQLGNSGSANSASPVQVLTGSGSLTAIVQVVSGAYHNLALDASGNVWAWGYNGDGELGNNSTANSDLAVQVSGLSNVIEIAAGDYHSMALTADGSIYTWGSNWGGQLGLGNTTNALTPQLVSGPGSAVAIAAAGDHSLSLSGSGTVSAWGYNGSGELGLSNAGNMVTHPTLIGGLNNISTITSGKQNSGSTSSGGGFYTAGSNSGSGLGNGSNNGSNNAQSAPSPQKQIPFINYAVIDLSGIATSASGQNIWDIEIGDGQNPNIAFAWYDYGNDNSYQGVKVITCSDWNWSDPQECPATSGSDNLTVYTMNCEGKFGGFAEEAGTYYNMVWSSTGGIQKFLADPQNDNLSNPCSVFGLDDYGNYLAGMDVEFGYGGTVSSPEFLGTLTQQEYLSGTGNGIIMYPGGLNNSGQYIGYADDFQGATTSSYLALWDGAVENIGKTFSLVVDINDSEFIVGISGSGNNQYPIEAQGTGAGTNLSTEVDKDFQQTVAGWTPSEIANSGEIRFGNFIMKTEAETTQRHQAETGYPDPNDQTGKRDLYQIGLPSNWNVNIMHMNDQGYLVGTGYQTDVSGSATSGTVPIMLVPASIVPDFNRDGVIDNSDYGKVTAANPYHFWINDNNDTSDTGGNDIPLGDNQGDASTTGNNWREIGNTRDLIDFFPVYLDIKQALDLLGPQNVDVCLCNKDSALAFVWTNLTPDQAKKYRTDISTAQSLVGKPSFKILPDQGTLNMLTADQINAIDNSHEGVILVESSKATTTPLEVRFYKKGTSTLLGSVKMPISTSGIEQMFRQKNLRQEAPGLPPMRDRGADSPNGQPKNYPDTLCNKDWVVFVHGYNVSGQQARGWQAQMFKRLFWSGSRAKFVGISWFGDPYDFSGETVPNYYEAVRSAFFTAGPFARYAATLSGGNVTVIAHSLGNMVVSSAIQDHQLQIKNYFMLDAAVALEAFGGATITTDSSNSMIHPDWYGYDADTYASEWHTLFPSTDGRNQLTWNNRFSGVAGSTNVFNFYSKSEDVLREQDGSPDQWLGGNTLQATLWDQIGNPGIFGWALQEKLKGRQITRYVPFVANTQVGGLYGGWGFNENGPTGGGVYSPSEANALSPSQLETNPVFDKGWIVQKTGDGIGYSSNNYGPDFMRQLFNDATGSNVAKQNRNQLLAEMIPALTLPTGANQSGKFGQDNNFDMPEQFVTDNNTQAWPNKLYNDNGVQIPLWKHSDIEQVSYIYLYGAFNKIVEKGNLKHE